MWLQRSSVWTHSISLLGVSLARASHCAGVGSAPAPAGASSPAATTQSRTSHDFDSRKLRGFGFKTLLLESWTVAAKLALERRRTYPLARGSRNSTGPA